MQRVADAEEALAWLQSDPYGASTGYDAEGWAAHTWVLHAMYENVALAGLGTHAELRRRDIEAGVIEPLIIGDINLDEWSTVTGVPLGWVVNPGEPWVRVTWTEYLSRFPVTASDRTVPPCFRWFPPGSHPVAIAAPPEGSMDEDTMALLLGRLDEHEQQRGGGEVYAFFAALAARDFDSAHLWKGRLEDIPSLIVDNGGGYSYSPSNIWPEDRSWFVWTDSDLSGTKVSGPTDLIAAIRSDDHLETVQWPRPGQP